MTTPFFGDPLGLAAEARWRESIEQRLTNLEARERVVVPAPLFPRPVNAFPSSDWYQATTAAGFTPLWEMIVPRWTALGAWVEFDWRTGAGTTGEVRLLSALGNASSAVVLGAASSGTITFRWLHNEDIWTDSVLWLTARRTGGANSVEVAFPHAALIPPTGCTLAGV